MHWSWFINRRCFAKCLLEMQSHHYASETHHSRVAEILKCCCIEFSMQNHRFIPMRLGCRKWMAKIIFDSYSFLRWYFDSLQRCPVLYWLQILFCYLVTMCPDLYCVFFYFIQKIWAQSIFLNKFTVVVHIYQKKIECLVFYS